MHTHPPASANPNGGRRAHAHRAGAPRRRRGSLPPQESAPDAVGSPDLPRRFREEVFGRDGEVILGRGAEAHQRARRARIPGPRREEAEGRAQPTAALLGPDLEVAADPHDREAAHFRALERHSRQRFGLAVGRESKTRAPPHVRPGRTGQRRPDRAQGADVRVRKEARRRDRHQPREGQNHGPRVA